MLDPLSEEAKLVGGVWMPAREVHFVRMMMENPKGLRVVEGKHTYQYNKLEAAMKHVRNLRLAVDIGAHVGLWSMWLQPRFQQLHAFEPVPLHCELFRRNVNMQNVTLHDAALGSVEGQVDIQVPREVTGNAHVMSGIRYKSARFITDPNLCDLHRGVPMHTLDSFEFQDVDFIKIDVEGFELPVMCGAAETIRRCRPIVVIEQKKNDAAYGDSEDAALKLLLSWGMKDLQVISGDHILGWGP